MDMNFCRRCGKGLVHQENHVYSCEDGHIIFANASPASTILLINDNNEILLTRRSIDPHKGGLDIAGGFNDGAETFESGGQREMKEELNLSPEDYSQPRYLTSVIDYYDYKGETIPVLTGLFWARVHNTSKIAAQDDVSEAFFTPIGSVDLDELCFPSSRIGVGLLARLIDND